MLQLMNRTYTREWYMAKVDRIREILPDCGISSDIIAGCLRNWPCDTAFGQMAPVGQACRHFPQEVQVSDWPQGVLKSEIIRTW